MRGARPLALAAMAASLSACGEMMLGSPNKKVILEDYAEGRVTQCAITDRLTGAKEMLFVSMPQKTYFLECYIQGIVTDYDDNPIQGVVVRAVAKGEQSFVDKSQAAFQTSSFDAGVSDSNGIYRIRFSLPILKNFVDVSGTLMYNPGWEQERLNLGKAYEPQMKQSPFRLYFDMKRGALIFSEGIRKLVVRSVRSDKPAKLKALPGAEAPTEEKPAEGEGKKGDEDFFKGFGLGKP